MSTVSRKNIGRRLNTLKRYRDILAEFEKYDCNDIPITRIWKKYIYPKFFISRQTLYKALSTDVEAEIKALEQQY